MSERTWPAVGDEVTLFCPVPAGSRIGASRERLEAGSRGTVEYVYPSGEVFEVRFSGRVVTVTRTEFTPH